MIRIEFSADTCLCNHFLGRGGRSFQPEVLCIVQCPLYALPTSEITTCNSIHVQPRGGLSPEVRAAACKQTDVTVPAGP